MEIFKINKDCDFKILSNYISPHKIGENIMSKKTNLHFFLIKNITSPAANILKQDALSIGAECVVDKRVILQSIFSNALLILNDKQISQIVEKEAIQDFGLKDIAKFLKNSFLKPKNPEIMGIVNINDDSFNPDSRVNKDNAIAKIVSQIEHGASIIDIGAVSSRPGSVYVGSKIEADRLFGLIDEIYKLKLFKEVKFSLDSFDKTCLKYALDRGFSIINDITGDINLIELAKEYDCQYILMHMQNLPQNMQLNPVYDDIIADIDKFFSSKIEFANSIGFDKIILDVGIGFGKSARDNLILINHLEHFLHFNYPLLVGASRKSVIDFYHKSDVKDRLAGSLFLHLCAIKNGAKIIRVHDVFEHAQVLKLNEAMDEAVIW